MRKRIGKNDVLLIVSIFVIAIIMMLFIGKFYMHSGDNVEITVDGKLYGAYPLLKNQSIDIKNSDGDTVNRLDISDGKASMSWADCPDKLCVRQKEISKENESIICLPNKVVVTITDSTKGEADIDSVAK